jgi:predicted negative regulator of RcsB-dependent stress response
MIPISVEVLSMARMTRKDLLNAPDEFLSTSSTVLTWIKENPQRFAIGVIIIASIFVGGYGFYHWKTAREFDGMRAYMKAADNSQLTLQVAQEYSDTKAGKLSKLRLARMSYDQGNQKMAISYAGEFIDSWGHEDTFHWQAVLIMATAYMKQNGVAKALPLLDDCIESAPKDIKDQALFLKASAQIVLGKNNEARQTLKAVSENYREIAKIMLTSQRISPGEKLNAE